MPRLALVALPITAALTAGLSTLAKRRWAATYDAYDQWAVCRIEAAREARTFKSMGCEAALYRRAQTHAGTVQATGLWYVCNGANAVVRALHPAAPVYIGWRLVLAGDRTLGDYVAFQAYAALLLSPLAARIDTGGKLQKAAVSLGRVFDLADEPPEADPAATIRRAERSLFRLSPSLRADTRAIPSEQKRANPPSLVSEASLRYTGRIRVRDVRFRYAPDAPGLELARLDLAPGEAVALIGPSECGKTTALRLLGQVERPDSGIIEAEASGARGPSWVRIQDAPAGRDHVAVCWQEPGLLSSSVRDTLLVTAEDVAGREIQDDELRAVLGACALDDRVRELARQSATDDPFDVTLAEGAASLSAGERERLALARTLLRVRDAHPARASRQGHRQPRQCDRPHRPITAPERAPRPPRASCRRSRLSPARARRARRPHRPTGGARRQRRWPGRGCSLHHRPAMHGDGSVAKESPRWSLTVPDARRALGGPSASDGPPPPSQGAERNGRRILRAVGLAGVLASVVAFTVPITRTVDLDGRLVPERVLPIRAAEPGLLTEILVAAGDTVRPGQLVARLRSPDLDEAVRTSIGHDPALLARRARLHVAALPWSERQPDGAADQRHAGELLASCSPRIFPCGTVRVSTPTTPCSNSQGWMPTAESATSFAPGHPSARRCALVRG